MTTYIITEEQCQQLHKIVKKSDGDLFAATNILSSLEVVPNDHVLVPLRPTREINLILQMQIGSGETYLQLPMQSQKNSMTNAKSEHTVQDVITLARQAGFVISTDPYPASHRCTTPDLMHFVSLVLQSAKKSSTI